MTKFTEKLQEKIVSFIEEDTYSVSEICYMLKINRKTFYEWKRDKPEFREAVGQAMERRDDKLLIIARNSLKKKLEGYTLTEIRTTYVPDKNDPDKLILKSKIVRQKEYAPDTHAIKLTLSRNEAKREEAQLSEPALTIVVRDPQTAERLHLLRKNLQKGFPTKYVENVEEPGRNANTEINGDMQKSQDDLSNPLPAPEPEKEKEKEKSPDDDVWVRRYDLPPGYLYERTKRRLVRPGEKIKELDEF